MCNSVAQYVKAPANDLQSMFKTLYKLFTLHGFFHLYKNFKMYFEKKLKP